MTGVFYHSVIHGLGFFICFKIQILHAQNNNFDQSERAKGPIYILKADKPRGVSVEHKKNS